MRTKQEIAEDAQNSVKANEASRHSAHETNIKEQNLKVGKIENAYTENINKAPTFEKQDEAIKKRDTDLARENTAFNERTKGINDKHDKKFEEIKQGEKDSYKRLQEGESQGQSKSRIQSKVDEKKSSEPQQTESAAQKNQQSTANTSQDEPKKR